MKVCLNIRFLDGPFGGGMQFAHALRERLRARGVEVVNTLEDEDIDLILHISPFPWLMKSASFSFLEAYRYKLRHPQTVIIQRVNECDARKGTSYMDSLIAFSSRFADHLVFVGSWLIPYYEERGIAPVGKSVVLSGADRSVFNPEGKAVWDGEGPLRLVTHHWGGSHLKGHDIYQRFDRLLDDPAFAERFSLTYIGQRPADVEYQNVKVLDPLSGDALAAEIKRHHVYLTASINEPSGNHHIEGASCGLPILYRDSGGLPEYCEGYGIMFNESDFEECLEQMRAEYSKWERAVRGYPRSAEGMADEFLSLFETLLARREEFARSGGPVRRAFWRVLDPVIGTYYRFRGLIG